MKRIVTFKKTGVELKQKLYFDGRRAIYDALYEIPLTAKAKGLDFDEFSVTLMKTLYECNPRPDGLDGWQVYRITSKK